MPKPWAKTEIDFINHPKFRALNANAICLWLEGKNYCDKHMTDGLIPTHIVKQFRFRGAKSVAALLASAGPKNESDVYAPLWEAHPVGYRMHDYLDYNDCRDVVLARIDLADEKREKGNERLRQWRATKKAKAEETKSEHVLKRVSNTLGNADETLYTETATATATPELPKNGSSGDCAETPRVSAPVALKFHTDGTPSEWPLTEQQITDWSTLYPSIDILGECRKAKAWIDADPKRRKTAGGMRRFLVNWLNNATNRPHAVGQAGSRTSGNAAALQRFATRAVNHD